MGFEHLFHAGDHIGFSLGVYKKWYLGVRGKIRKAPHQRRIDGNIPLSAALEGVVPDDEFPDSIELLTVQFCLHCAQKGLCLPIWIQPASSLIKRIALTGDKRNEASGVALCILQSLRITTRTARASSTKIARHQDHPAYAGIIHQINELLRGHIPVEVVMNIDYR